MTAKTDDTEWEVVREESPDQIKFTEDGDQVIGRYTGQMWITDPNEGNEFLQLYFRDVLAGNVNSPDSFQPVDLACMNAGYVLREAFTDNKIPAGSMVRLTRIKARDVGQASPMNDIRVEVAKHS